MPSRKSMPQIIKTTRRQLLKNAIGGTIACSVGLPSASAEEPLSEDDALAVALGYKVNADSVDPTIHKNFKPEQRCINCLQFKAKAQSTEGNCAIFPGKTVASSGWCKVWVST